MPRKRKTRVSHIPNPHDLAFKSALADIRVARDFFTHHLPKHIQPLVDLSTLQLQESSFIDPELTTSASDLLYRTTFTFEQKEPGYLYILSEHQSTSDYWMPLRLLRYICRILDQHRQQHPETRRLPLIVPLIFYTCKDKYSDSTDLFQLFGEHADLAKTLLFGPYHLSSLHQVADDDILTHQWVGLAEMLLKHAQYRNIVHLFQEILPVWLEPLLTESGAEQYVLHMLNYAFNVGEGDVPSLDIFLQVPHTKLASKTVEKKVMTIAEQLKQAGRQEGMEKGMEKGRQEEREAIVLKMLRKGMDLTTVAAFTDMSLEEIEVISSEQVEYKPIQISRV